MSSAEDAWTRRGGKSRLTILLGPMDRQWLAYVVGASLVNLWVALAWLLSSSQPLKTLATDGSMLIYCMVTIWLTAGALRHELKGHWRRGVSAHVALWRRHDLLCGIAGVTTLSTTVFYAQCIASDSKPTVAARVACSVIAVIVGAVYSREAMAATYDATTQRNGEAV
ncbi:MAG TPA: hypothetical protein VFF79_02105 [Conexibacter sp.]|jgi:hypothetical protein|nr:hypothetical protein [Conexibacter sp.]